jgi:probable F420-dependent oxidoreductase
VRFSIGLPTDRVDSPEEFVTGDAVMECAAAVESMGFDACFVTDHPAPDTKWLATGGHHALDPLIALSFAAAATTRLRLQTHVMVLAYRNPLLTAKSLLTLDALSKGRVILGVAAGYLKPEFAALGVDFDERNALTDEAIDVIRLALTTDALEYEGHHFRSRGTTMRPRAESTPPIWIGGNSRAAIRRAVDRGDGWVPFPNPAAAARAVRTPLLTTIDDLAERLAYLHTYASEQSRPAPLDICFHPFSLTAQYDASAVRDELARLHDLGVTWCVLSAPAARDRAEYLDGARRFAAEVMGPTS